MPRLVLKMSISLDGFVAAPDGSGAWMARSRDEGGRRWVEETLRQAGLHLLGRRSFEEMARFWPAQGGPIAAAMNDVPKAVFTRQAAYAAAPGTPGGWAKAEILAGDLAAEIGRLKERPGRDLLAQGGAGFARSLVATGLVDEYRLVTHPVALGHGLSLFADLPTPMHLDLVGTTVFRSGTVAHVYRPV